MLRGSLTRTKTQSFRISKDFFTTGDLWQYPEPDLWPLFSLQMLVFSEHPILKEMWPEGAKAVTEVTKRPKSTGTRFKESMIALVENLKTKVLSTVLRSCEPLSCLDYHPSRIHSMSAASSLMT